MTDDRHDIFFNGQKINESKRIKIYDEVWLVDSITILKSIQTSKGSGARLGSLVTQSCLEENVILVRNPVKIIKKGITWKK